MRILAVVLGLFSCLVAGCGGGGGGGGDDPEYAFGSSTYIQYRVYQSGETRYQAWLPMTKNGNPIQETDIVDIRLFDSINPEKIQETAKAFQAQKFMQLDCTVSPCIQSGPRVEHAYWLRYPPLAAGDYSFDVDTVYGQTLTHDFPYPGQLTLPIVLGGDPTPPSTMHSEWDGGNLVLSWVNPDGDASWLEVDKLRISLFDSTGNVVLNITMNPTDQSVTVDSGLLAQAKALGNGTLEAWEVQTRAYDVNDMNYARGYSFWAHLAIP